MASHALDHRLFNQTEALTDANDSVVNSGPKRVELIDGWLKVIDGHPNAEIVAGKLNELRDQLKLNQPDPDQVKDLLLTLADHTSQLAQGSNTPVALAGELENLATSLRKLAGVQVSD